MAYTFNPLSGKLDYFVPGDTSVATANIRANVLPTESPDGTRTVFTVPETYLIGTLTVYLNGLHETYVSETTDTTFTFDIAPLVGDVITLDYAVSGSSTKKVVVKSANYTAEEGDQVIKFTSDATLTLPSATGSGRHYLVRAEGCTVTIDGNLTDTVNGVTEQTLFPNDSVQIIDEEITKWGVY